MKDHSNEFYDGVMRVLYTLTAMLGTAVHVWFVMTLGRHYLSDDIWARAEQPKAAQVEQIKEIPVAKEAE